MTFCSKRIGRKSTPQDEAAACISMVGQNSAEVGLDQLPQPRPPCLTLSEPAVSYQFLQRQSLVEKARPYEHSQVFQDESVSWPFFAIARLERLYLDIFDHTIGKTDCTTCLSVQANVNSLRDLWGLAVAKLKDKDKCRVPQLTGDLEHLRIAVEERQRECVEKQWCVSSMRTLIPKSLIQFHCFTANAKTESSPGIGDNKSKIVLRDIFAKVAAWIQTFVEAGDIAVQYDPGHAALPWALVRFLLKVLGQEHDNVQYHNN